MRIELKAFPPSTNKLYFQKGYKRIKTQEFRVFEQYVNRQVSQYSVVGKNKPFAFHVDFFSNWLTKKGEVRKKDLDNYLKVLIDCVCAALKIDDCFVFEILARKCISLEEKITIDLIDLTQKEM